MSIHRVIERLETYVRESTWLPMGYRVVSLERVLELIEKMRSTLPEEVGRARVITNNKERVMREAQERAQAIVDEATHAHHQLMDQSEIVRRARVTAEVVLREAEERARKIREGAEAYAAAVLGDLHARLEVALGSVVKGEETLAKSRTAAQTADEQPSKMTVKVAKTAVSGAKEHARAVFDAQEAEVDESFVERVPVRSVR